MTDRNLGDTSQVEGKTAAAVTSSNVEKIKDPKRVEQGKKLVAISKAAKEKKAREKFESEAAADRALAMENSWNIDYGYLVGRVGVFAAVGALYFAYRQDRALATDRTGVTKETNVIQGEATTSTPLRDRTGRREVPRLDMFD